MTRTLTRGSPFASIPQVDSPPAALDFATVYKEEFAFVWRNLSRFGVPPSEVDDAVQQVFMVVHRRLGELGPTESSNEVRLRSWLFQVVRRVASEERRARSARPVATTPENARMMAPSHERPDVAYEEKAAAAQLYAILERMEGSRREVFVLADLEGFSAPEIAEVTGTNLNTVYGRLRAAREEFEGAVARIHAEAKARWNR